MKIIKFEGTAEEFAVVSKFFEDGGESIPESGTSSSFADEELQSSVRKTAYKVMLSRIPISEAQLDIYKALKDGELEYEEYRRVIDRTEREVAGVHGALGKRIKGTKEIQAVGLPGNMEAIMTWRNEGGKYFLSLKPEFLQVLLEVGDV